MRRAGLLLVLLAAFHPPSAVEAQDPAAVADSAWVAGDHERALRLYEELRARGPVPALFLHRMALIHIWNERPGPALELLDEAVSTDPDYHAARLERALLHGRAGRLEEAIGDLERYLEVDPDHLPALETRARYASWTGDHDRALEIWDRILARDPSRDDLRLARARVLSWDGRLERSVEAYRELLARTPDDPDVLAGLAQVLSWTGAYDEARELYGRALEGDPAHPIARQGLAQVATWSGDLAEGERRWREIRRDDPAQVDAAVGLASNLRMQGREREAAAVLRGLDPEAGGTEAVVEELERLDRALAPRLRPSAAYTADSDDNRIVDLRMNGRWKPIDPVELSLTMARRDLSQTTRPELDQIVWTADLSATWRRRSGWGLRAGLGIWRPGASAGSSAATGLVGVSMPPARFVRGDLTLQRTVFDVTALVADVQVDQTELRLDGTVRTGPRSSVGGTLSTARFEGTERNHRHLLAARYTHRVRPWLATGPAVRAFTFDRTVADGYWNPESYLIVELPLTFDPTSGPWRPRVETAVGYQRSAGEPDPWSSAFRVQAGLTRTFTGGGEAGVSAVYADSGAQRLSGGSESDGYRFRGVTLFLLWPL